MGKAKSHMAPNLCYFGAECFTKKLCMRRDAWAGPLLWWNCQSLVVHSCGFLNHLNSFHGGMLKLTSKFDIDPLLHSLSHFECNGHTVHMLTQVSTAPTDQYSEVVTIHTCTFQSTLLGCQVTSMLHKLFSLYEQWLDFFQADLILCLVYILRTFSRNFTNKNIYCHGQENSQILSTGLYREDLWKEL